MVNKAKGVNMESMCNGINKHYVNEYLLNRKYGGCEEGGWWFDTGIFVKCHGSFDSLKEAHQCKGNLYDYLDDARQGQYEPNSVLCDGYTEIYVEGQPGQHFPAALPHYC